MTDGLKRLSCLLGLVEVTVRIRFAIDWFYGANIYNLFENPNHSDISWPTRGGNVGLNTLEILKLLRRTRNNVDKVGENI